jgi:hypothetical protein
MWTEGEGGSRTVILQHPVLVTWRGPEGERRESVDRLTFRRATGADLRALEGVGDDLARAVRLFCRLAGIDLAVYDRLDLLDIAEAHEAIADFLPRSPGTGPS